MGFKNVIGKIFSPEDEEVQTYASAEVEVDPAPEYQTNNRTEPATPSYAQEQQPAATAPKRETVARAADSPFELKVVKPENFASVGQIADHLINRRTVVLNLESTSKETARRIIDFLNGVAYTLDGQIKAVANNTYVITPSHVDISGESLTESKPAATVTQAADDSGFGGF
ncbi:MAG: cell division protein SepF [Clostridia bacterium]|nr:cell division protein SepF [Clostridia bacterium]